MLRSAFNLLVFYINQLVLTFGSILYHVSGAYNIVVEYHKKYNYFLS